MNDLEEKIGYHFKDPLLLKKALTHTSYANEHGEQSNEKLEFLGDAILEFIISEYLYEHLIHLKEGEMTKVRASVVCEQSLYRVGFKLDFSDFLYLGKSEIVNNGKARPAILADSIEAVIAAIFIDGGMKPAREFVLRNLKESIDHSSKYVGMKDYKTVLQEKLQSDGEVLIQYEIIKETGPDHDKNFIAQVKCNGIALATGEGKSKKEAQMQAAKAAIKEEKNKEDVE